METAKGCRIMRMHPSLTLYLLRSSMKILFFAEFEPNLGIIDFFAPDLQLQYFIITTKFCSCLG